MRPDFPVFCYVADQLTSLETYSLMARCLAGEAVYDDKVTLNDLLATHPRLKIEYEHLCVLFSASCKDPLLQEPAVPLKKKLEQLHRRLSEEGSA